MVLTARVTGTHRVNSIESESKRYNHTFKRKRHEFYINTVRQKGSIALPAIFFVIISNIGHTKTNKDNMNVQMCNKIESFQFKVIK